MITTVKKSGGYSEAFNAEKINRVIFWACEGLDVSPSEIAIKSQLQVHDGITTKDIHKTVVKSAADLITVEEPDYQYAAARLLLFGLRKEAYGSFEPPRLKDHVEKMVAMGKYDRHLLEDYDDNFWENIDQYIKHDRDFQYTYIAMRQWEDKYLVKDRVTHQIYESPQFALMLVAMCLYASEKENRLGHILALYNATSEMKISLATPILAGVRTPTRQFSSCVLIEAGDDIDQIFSANTAQGKYAAQRAGIGINFGRIRGEGAPIRGGEVKHAGTVPIVRMFQESLLWTSQGGVRKAASTLFYPLWHWDVENLLVMKNNRGIESQRAREVDYGVQFNKLMYQRLKENGNITLFHPNVRDGALYESFFAGDDSFEKLYLELENDPSVEKKTVRAVELFTTFAMERNQTGRLYVQNVDTCNTNSPFIAKKAPIKQSNLCMEILLPTFPITELKNPNDPGEIALCTLSAINLGVINTLDEIAPLTAIVVRTLDNLLDYQNYPVLAAEKNKLRRTLGIGWTNLAYYLAKRGLNYSSGNANNEVHALAEAFQYSLLEASSKLAVERGPCEKYGDTTYSQGILPIDRYTKKVDTLHSAELKCDWEGLRARIKVTGLRNSTLSTMMPCETSSQMTNSTNGIEPPRGPRAFKASKVGNLPQLVPDVKTMKDAYEYLWDQPNHTGYLQLCAIIQKFADQSISTNTNYQPWSYPEGKLPIKDVLRDMIMCYSWGTKTLYYSNIRDGNDQEDSEQEDVDDGCGSGACKL